MTSRSDRLRQIPPNWDLWQKLYYKHQQGYIRQRLLAIKYLSGLFHSKKLLECV